VLLPLAGLYELSLVIAFAHQGNTSMQWLDTEGETQITAAIDECGGVFMETTDY